MPGYKYPNIDSGATPIGSASRAPDRKIIWERIRQEEKKKKFWAYDQLQVSDHSLGGYSHQERWSRTWWRFTSRRSSMKNKEENLRVHCRWQAPENKLDFSLPSGDRIQEPEDFTKSKIWSLETQPESVTQVESRGLLTWLCPLGTHRLVYRVRSTMEVD
jgi:hypothetical protein